jgi:hypothetical protein
MAVNQKNLAIKKDYKVELKWSRADSNRGHTDFQSDALPTELRNHLKKMCFVLKRDKCSA